MSLLPPQFQAHLPHTLGAKITAMPAPPKPPHVHQWVAVPDSKIHSRCAECGTVTLTEIVAPKVIGFDMASGPDQTAWFGRADAAIYANEDQTAWFSWADATAFFPAGKRQTEFRTKLKALDAEVRAGEAAMDLVSLLRTPDLAPPTDKTATEVMMKARASRLAAWADIAKSQTSEIKDSALIEAGRDFLKGSADRAWAVKHARSVLDAMGYKKAIEIPQHRRAEFLKALTTQPQRHYTSITTPDGKVRMVETDAEGWIKNDGTQPVADRAMVEVRSHERDRPADKAINFNWQYPGFTHWRPAA